MQSLNVQWILNAFHTMGAETNLRLGMSIVHSPVDLRDNMYTMNCLVVDGVFQYTSYSVKQSLEPTL